MGNLKRYHPDDFNIPKGYYDLKLFDASNCSDVGWMLVDATTYLNLLTDQYERTEDKRYLEIIELMKPKGLNGE